MLNAMEEKGNVHENGRCISLCVHTCISLKVH